MRTIQQRQRNKEYEFKFSAVVRRCCAGVWLPASRRRPRLGSPGRSAGLSLFLSLSLSLCLFWTTTCETRFFVWVSFVFDCLVAHVKTKCQTQDAIPTRSREKTEPNPNKTFFISFCSTFVHTIAERDVTFPKNRTDLFCASANSILSRSTKAERILSRTFP